MHKRGAKSTSMFPAAIHPNLLHLVELSLKVISSEPPESLDIQPSFGKMLCICTPLRYDK